MPGYLAFCESDFVVIPSGVLLANISGKPMFLNDPTYPHDGVITLAHCTGPRRMNGKDLEPVRILTHFESDYGASPKVEMHKGQIDDEHYSGLSGQALGRPQRSDRRCPVPGHLPLADRYQLQVRQQAPGRADAGLPLDDLLRRLHEGDRLRLQEGRHHVGRPDGVRPEEARSTDELLSEPDGHSVRLWAFHARRTSGGEEMGSWRIVLVWAVVCTLSACATAATVYVSPAGNNQWSGSLAQPNAQGTDGPVATLDRARDILRQKKAECPRGKTRCHCRRPVPIDPIVCADAGR